MLFPTRAALAIAGFVCVLAPTALVALQIDAHPKFSPLDEAPHFDYVERVAEAGVPRQGQRLLDSTLREIACRGNALGKADTPPCTDSDLSPDQFPAGGYQYEAQQPPTYYVITVPLRWVGQNALGIDHTLTATRAAGILWLAGGLLLLWAAGRVLEIRPVRLGSVLLLLVAAPSIVYLHASVTNDVTAVPAAGVVALAAALSHRRQGSGMPGLLAAAGAFAVACKVTNLFAVVVVSALFAVAAIGARAPGEPWIPTARRWLPDGGALLVAGLAVAVLWTLVHRSIALIDLSDEPTYGALRGGSQALGPLLEVAANFLQPLTTDAAPAVTSAATLGQDVQRPFHVALSFVLIGAGLAGLFVSPRRWHHTLGLIAVPALYVGGVAIGLAFMVTLDSTAGAGVEGRYGMSVAPLLLLALAASLRGTWAVGAIAVLGLASFGTTLAVMAT